MTQGDYHCLFSDLFFNSGICHGEIERGSQFISRKHEKAARRTYNILWDYLLEIYNEKLLLALKLALRVGA